MTKLTEDYDEDDAIIPQSLFGLMDKLTFEETGDEFTGFED